MNKPLTHDEMQQIEHSNKILREHLELIKLVTESSAESLNTYIPNLRNYVNAIVDIRKLLGEEIAHIYKSTRELSIVTKDTQQIGNFCSAITQLEKLLTPSFVDKLNKVIK